MEREGRECLSLAEKVVATKEAAFVFLRLHFTYHIHLPQGLHRVGFRPVRTSSEVVQGHPPRPLQATHQALVSSLPSYRHSTHSHNHLTRPHSLGAVGRCLSQSHYCNVCIAWHVFPLVKILEVHPHGVPKTSPMRPSVSASSSPTIQHRLVRARAPAFATSSRFTCNRLLQSPHSTACRPSEVLVRVHRTKRRRRNL